MKRSLLFVVGLLVAAGVLAQSQTPRVITFEEAIQIALRNSVLLNTARNNLELAQAQKLSAIGSIGPNVNATISASQFDGNSFNQQVGQVVNGVRDNVSASLSANILIFNGFSTINYLRAATEQLDAQTYLVQRTTQDVMNTVAVQYLQVLLDTELLTIARQNFEAQLKLLDQVQAQVELGAKSPVDQYNQDALTKGAEYRAVLAEVTLDNDRALLAQTLQLDANETFDVQKPVWDPGAVIQSNLQIDSLIEVAKVHRADYLRAVKMENAAHHQAMAVMGNMLPSLVGFANVGSSYNYQHNVPKTVLDENGVEILNPEYPRPFSDQMRTNNLYKQYGVQLSIPIFNGLRNRATYVQNRVTFRNNKIQHHNLDIQIRNDVLRSVRTYEGSRKAYVVSLDQATAAQAAFEFETERYNLGVTNFVDYTNANRALVQAQTDKAQAEYRLVFQKILIDYAIGTLRPEDVIGQ